MSRTQGAKFEQLACEYLVKQGLVFVEKNYQRRIGEIDLIMREGEILVFIEVKARAASAFGGAVASITEQKKVKLRKTAEFYLVAEQKYDKIPCRFDVVCIDDGEIDWIQDAF